MEGCAAPLQTPMAACPACGQPGRRVKAETLDALVRPETPRLDATYRFCATAGCEVAWFGEATGHRVALASSRVRVGQKETAPDRALCYCFGYSAADVARELRPDGTSPVAERITEHCRRGEDRCVVTNPQGACCLGNVRAAGKVSAVPDACGCNVAEGRS